MERGHDKSSKIQGCRKHLQRIERLAWRTLLWPGTATVLKICVNAIYAFYAFYAFNAFNAINALMFCRRVLVVGQCKLDMEIAASEERAERNKSAWRVARDSRSQRSGLKLEVRRPVPDRKTKNWEPGSGQDAGRI